MCAESERERERGGRGLARRFEKKALNPRRKRRSKGKEKGRGQERIYRQAHELVRGIA